MKESDIEKAEQLQQEKLKHSIDQARKDLANTLRATGLCLNCEEPLPEGIRFCDKDCAEDYDKYSPTHTI